MCWVDAPTCHVDVRVFDTERLAALAAAESGDDDAVIGHGSNAIAQYRGDLLPGVYDDWLAEARARLERKCVELCDLVSDARARAGDLAGALIAARRRIELQPLEEVGYRVLMGLQADMGDRAAAVSTYHHCASVLESELGVVPDEATRAVVQRLMTRRAGCGTAHGPPTAAGTTAARIPLAGKHARAAPASPSATHRAVGRASRPARHLAGRGRRTARHGAGRGGAGVGKTRLVTEVAELARQQGAIVVSTQCFAAPGRLALAPVADWLRDPAVQAAAATLDPAWRAEVARLVPDRASPRTIQGRGRWRRLAAAPFLRGACPGADSGAPPLLLVLDNVQWCDRETLDFITFASA